MDAATPPLPPPVHAPPTHPGPIPPPPKSKINIPGLIGLIFCSVATLASPTGFLGFTLCLLVPLGGAGLVLSLVGCFFRPRWYGVVGLGVGLTCVLGWGAIFLYSVWGMSRSTAAVGLPMTQWGATSMSCCGLVAEVEGIRSTSGSLPTTFATSAPSLANDPWGHPYRYKLTPISTANPYGYTFMSDGADGISGTSDDFGLIEIHPTDGTFPLLPPPSPNGTPTPPAPSSP